MAKLTGTERYVDDLPLHGAWWGMTVRSPVPRGRIRQIRFGDAVDWSQFVIVDHRDIPGPNEIYLIETDQPVLAATEVRHVHEPVVLIAHPSREMVRRAIAEVDVEVDLLDPTLDFMTAPAPEQIQHGDDNVLKHISIEKGDVDRALSEAPVVVEGIYETGAQEHVYIENQGMAAWLDGDVLVVQGSMQCPYYVFNALAHALSRDASNLRVLQAPTGGGFGGKEDYPSNLAVHAALLALKCNQPVKMIYDRTEDMAATTKRHPARIVHRTGVDRKGRLLAQDIDVVLDGGAYVTLSPVVLSRALIHSAGPYACDNVRIQGQAMLTNSVPFGAFRGFGAPQTHFANERHMDVIARRLQIDPVELRHLNLIRDGQTTPTGQVICDGTDRTQVLETAVRTSAYRERQERNRAFNESHPYLRRGTGLACFHHGAGFTGAGELHLASRLQVAGRPDGRIEIRSANTEMGQGTQTIFLQIAAQRLGVDPQSIVLAPVDTQRVPNSGPTVASRTAMVVGRLIERACDDLVATLGLDQQATEDQIRGAIIQWHQRPGADEPTGSAAYEPPAGYSWNDKTYQGDAYATFAWATYVADVEIDLRTYGVRVIDFTAVQEVGKVLNETLATGQIQGGVVQAIGWALMEECRWQNGAMENNQLTNYIIPTSDDVPPIRVVFLENPYPEGAQGAKGLGELPMDGGAPAILNAMAAAIDVDLRAIPATPERLHEVLTS